MSYLCFKPSIDTREKKNVIRSRIGIERECRWIYRDTDLFAYIGEMVEKKGSHPDWILVDEAQFLARSRYQLVCGGYLWNQCDMLRTRTDFQTRPFEGSRRLFEIADTIDEIKSTCKLRSQNDCERRIDSRRDNHWKEIRSR